MSGLCCHETTVLRHRPQVALAAVGLSFKRLTAGDRPVLEKFLSRHPQRIAGYTFSELTAWNAPFAYEWATAGDETCIIKGAPDADGRKHFIQPVGLFDDAAQALFLQALRDCGYPVKVLDVSGEFLGEHRDFIARHFEVENDPGQANYIYRTPDLATLAGKAYAKKRNLIAQARKLYDWTAVPVTAANAEKCLAVLAGIAQETPEGVDMSPDVAFSARQEMQAAETALGQFGALGYKGVLIEVEGEPAGFALYEVISPEMAVISFEKGLRRYKGIYQVVNQETARAIAVENVPFINREEDMNLPGLRQAKDSYHPCEMAPAYTLRLK
ncbi:MAG: DUF2156 domain-containing protein [Alphaproteobacteria bacterium]|nr:DUF2156 domain-containing protein [Alphaproteobacteria bacterium]